MHVIIEQIINGLTIGSFYGLIALGYSLVYGVLKLINFAHGDFFALGSYIGYTVLVFGSALATSVFGLWGGILMATLIAAFCVAGVGLLVERAAYRPIYASGRLPAVVSALGASIVIQNVIMIIWGAALPGLSGCPDTQRASVFLGHPYYVAATGDSAHVLYPHGFPLLSDSENHLWRRHSCHGFRQRYRSSHGDQFQPGHLLYFCSGAPRWGQSPVSWWACTIVRSVLSWDGIMA